ncbi:hypothetical protein B4U80_06114, partial [Leptotrombidium deliense]
MRLKKEDPLETMKFKLLCISVCLFFGVTSASENGTCVMRGKCGTFPTIIGDLPLPCVYDGPPEKLNDSSIIEQLSSLCPKLGLKENPTVCFDVDQLFYDNETHEETSDLRPIKVTTSKCNEPTGYGYNDTCSCMDCFASCPHKPKKPQPEPFEILGVDGMYIVMGCVYTLFVIISTIAFVVYFARKRREEATVLRTAYPNNGNDYVSAYRNPRVDNSDKPLKMSLVMLHVLLSFSEDSLPLAGRIFDESVVESSEVTNTKQSWGVSFEAFLSRMFSNWGRFVAKHPTSIIIIGVYTVVVMSMGLTKFDVITNPVDLWSSPKSLAREQKSNFDNNFGPFYRIEQIIIKHKDTKTIVHRNQTYSSIYDQNFLLKALKLQNRVMQLVAKDVYDNEVKLEDICFSPMANRKCAVQSPFTWFQNEEKNLFKTGDKNSNYLDHLSNCWASPFSINDTSVGLSCLGDYGGPALPNVALGGFDINKNNYANATALVITIVVNNHNNEYQVKRAMAWEKEYITFMKKAVIDFGENASIAFYSERSVEDELERQSQSDVSTIAISYLVMFAYVSIALGQFTSFSRLFVDSKICLGLTGVLIVLGSVFASIGFLSFCGVKATLIILEVIPFLILAVGVDNIFILVQAFQRDLSDGDEEIEEKVARVLGKVGPSLLISSVAESTCFFLGALSSMPAVRVFALNAAVALVVDFLLQMTVFVALLTLDWKRQKSMHFDLFCCFKHKALEETENENDPGLLYKFFETIYAPFLMKDVVRELVIIIFVGWLCSSIA